MKKILAITLTLALLLGNFSILFTGTASAEVTSAEASLTTSSAKNVFENVGMYDWYSTSKSVTVTTTADSVTVNDNELKNVYVLVTLEANSLYTLSFKYEGENPLADITVYAMNDIDLLNNSLYKGVAVPDSGISSMAYYVDVADTVTAKIATNENTIYYLALAGGEGAGGFTASEFSLVKTQQSGIEADYSFDREATNLLESATLADWATGWAGTTLNMDGEDIKIGGAGHSLYIKVDGLKADTEYNFSLLHRNVAVEDIRVYAASEITDTAKQLVSDGWVTGGTTDLAAGQISYDVSLISKALPDANNYYTASESFKATAETEYYIIIDCGPAATDKDGYMRIKSASLTEVAADPNLLADISADDWSSCHTGREASESGGVISIGNFWRSCYTVLTLEPNTQYDFSFKFRNLIMNTTSGGVRVISTADVTPEQLVNTNGNIPSFSGVTDYMTNKNIPVPTSKDKWCEVTGTVFTGKSTTYYLIIDSRERLVDTDSNLYMKNFSLTATPAIDKQNNALNDSVMEGLTWGAQWATNGGETRYPATLLDKSASYSGTSYAVRFGSSARYRDNYTTITLAADTTYNFSFRYKSDGSCEYIDSVGLVDASLVDMSTYKGDFVSMHAVSGATVGYLTNATIGKSTDGTWNEVSATITTGAATEYILFMNITFTGSTYTSITLSDFSMISTGRTSVNNILAGVSATDWTSGWNGTKGSNDNGSIKLQAAWHSVYTKVSLNPNSNYTFYFEAAYVKARDIRVYAASEITNTSTQLINSAEIVTGGTYNLAPNTITTDISPTKQYATITEAQEYYSAYEAFTTSADTEYYIIIDNAWGSIASAVLDGSTGGDNSIRIKNIIFEEFSTATEQSGIWVGSAEDNVSIKDEGYLTYNCGTDSMMLPFFYDSSSRYTLSFDLRGIEYGTSGINMSFRATSNGRSEGQLTSLPFTYSADAVSMLRKSSDGTLSSLPTGFSNATVKSTSGINDTDSSIWMGLIHTFEADDAVWNSWQHIEIEIDPSAIYYTGLANLSFYGTDASIAIDNFKIEVIPEETIKAAEEGFKGAYAYAMRSKSRFYRQGLRVVSEIAYSLRNADAYGFKLVEYGTLAIMAESLGDSSPIYEMLGSDIDLRYGYAYKKAYNAEEAEKDRIYETVCDDDGNITAIRYSGVLTGIDSSRFDVDYAVRAYMILENAEGVRAVIYDEPIEPSVYDVTYTILNTEDAPATDIAAANEAKAMNSSAYSTWETANHPSTASKTVALTIKNGTGDSPVITKYRGLSGTIYHAFGFMKDDTSGRIYSDDMIETELNRLDDMGMTYMRTRFMSQWIFNDTSGYNWNSNRLGYFFNYANALDERDMEVMLQVGWHFEFVSQEGTHSIKENDYFNGEGSDRYSESSGYDLSGWSTANQRIVKSARRYGYMIGETLKKARSKGINNINYLSYFVEPCNSYSDGGTAGHDKEEYLLFCQQMKQKLAEMSLADTVKHVGPNEAGYSPLLEYVLKEDPTLFDIYTSHFYNSGSSYSFKNYSSYYNRAMNDGDYNLLNGYQKCFPYYADMLAEYGSDNTEFWLDEFNVKYKGNAYDVKATDNAWAGLALAMNAIVAQQLGLHNIILFQSFDQLWLDRTTTSGGAKSEFSAGIHTTQNTLAPSLIMSDVPYAQYYTASLFTKYNGNKNGSVYATNNAALQKNNSYAGVYVGAVKLENGKWTVTVVNMRSETVKVHVSFGSAINQTLYRHMQVADEVKPTAKATLAGVDLTFKNVGTSFSDVLPAGSIAIYTGVAD